MSAFLSDYDLCMLEHLAYMNNDDGLKSVLKGDAYIPLQECTSVKQYVEQFDTDALRKVDPDSYTNGDNISRKEYATIIDYMYNNEQIYNLTLNQVMKNEHENTCPLAYAFQSNSGEYIVIFKGSTQAFEWKDNVEGIATADTQSQRDAVQFVDSINSDNITVVGHSKGGNKAMYCAVVSDKVKRCISMDGQGFSDEFIKKYQYKIATKSQNIKNISYCSDYVHALMRQIPGSIQLYTGKGYGSNGADSLAGCHSPNSIFSYYENESGQLCVQDEFAFCDETSSIKIIHGLVEYIMYSDYEDKEGVINYLAYVVGNLGGNSGDYINKVLSGEESIDAEKATQLLAYVVKYCNETGVSAEEVYLLLLDIHAIDADITKWGGMDPLGVIQLFFDYISSNEQDQNYVALKFTVLLADRVFDKEKSRDKLYDTAWNILKNIKNKYNGITFDASKKTHIYTERLHGIGPLTDFYESSTPGLYYNLNGIETALLKMQELDGSCIENEFNNIYAVSGKCVDSICAINDLYNSTFEKLYTLLQNTKDRVQEIYDTVCVLENM